MWPAYVPHGVRPHVGGVRDRVAVSFNVWAASFKPTSREATLGTHDAAFQRAGFVRNGLDPDFQSFASIRLCTAVELHR